MEPVDLAAFATFRRIAMLLAALGLALGAADSAAKGKKKIKGEGRPKPDAARVMLFDPDEPKEGPRIAFDAQELAKRFDSVMLFTDVKVRADSKSSDGETVELNEEKVTTDAPPVVNEEGGKKKKSGKTKQKSKKAADAGE
jgi:hypothetical protein